AMILTLLRYTTLFRSRTVQVGVIGVVAPKIMQWDRTHLEGKVIAADAVQSVEKFIPEMKAEGADVIVVLSHSGIGDATHEIGERSEEHTSELQSRENL